MTVTALDQRPAADVPADVATPRRAVAALARIEAVRLLRHPLTILASLSVIGFAISGWFSNQANQYPVLQDVDRDTELAMMMLLGGAALIAGNLAVLRAHRHGMSPLSDVLILPERARTVAHLLAVVPVAGLAAVLVVGRIAILTIFAPAAGHANPYELAIGPVTVLLLGALGVLLGRLTRSAIAAPLVVLVLLATLIVFPMLTSGGPAEWFQPVIPAGEPEFGMPAPAYLMDRPAGAHLAYLIGLTGLLAMAALFRSGARTLRVAAATIVALALAVEGGITQTAGPSAAVTAARADAMNHPSAHQTCRTLDHVTYCAFADFVRWIPGWNTVVQAVRSRVPAEAQPPIVVRQRILVASANDAITGNPIRAWNTDDAAAGTPDAVSVDTRWGDSRSEANFAGLVAARLVGPTATGVDRPICGAPAVLVAWLAGQVSPTTAAGLRLLAAAQNGGVTFTVAGLIPAVDIGQPALTVAMEALAKPADQIAARVRQSWITLTAASTSESQAAAILGVAVPAAGTSETATSRGGCQ